MSTVPMHTAPGFLPAFADKKSAVLKHVAQSERLGAVVPASRLEMRPRPEMLATAIAEWDAMIGGIPRGCLTEICGSASSGKTSILLATMAAATRGGESCVLIDASDSFDPSSGAVAGCDFTKLLWVRCGNAEKNSSSGVGRGSLAKKSQTVPHLFASFAESGVDSATDARRTTYSEHCLEQVLKATDLILQSGGFGLIALDLAGIPEKSVRRIPLASWFRFVRAVEHTRTALLVISEVPCAQTCAALAVKVWNSSAISHQPSAKPSHAEVLKEIQVETEIIRTRLDRKPMQSVRTSFSTQAVRAG